MGLCGIRPGHLPSFADHDADRAIVIDAARVDSSGPCIIENFLDQAHFPFVHAGYLGEVPNTEITRYDVAVVDGELRLSDCDVWQPRPWPTAETGAPVRYDYVVSHPYAAMLRKVPGGAEGDDGFSILLAASPVTETSAGSSGSSSCAPTTWTGTANRRSTRRSSARTSPSWRASGPVDSPSTRRGAPSTRRRRQPRLPPLAPRARCHLRDDPATSRPATHTRLTPPSPARTTFSKTRVPVVELVDDPGWRCSLRPSDRERVEHPARAPTDPRRRPPDRHRRPLRARRPW